MEHSSKSSSPFIPLLLATSAIVLLLVWQLLISWNARGNLKTQFETRQEQAAKSQQVQQNIEALINDLINLSATDADAKKIVDKYNIRRNAPAAQ
jgi:hypothetical protein